MNLPIAYINEQGSINYNFAIDNGCQQCKQIYSHYFIVNFPALGLLNMRICIKCMQKMGFKYSDKYVKIKLESSTAILIGADNES